MGMNTSGLMTSTRSDWRTPRKVARLVSRVLGGIDLDPCGPIDPSTQVVPARRTLYPSDDGLCAEWGTGTVFMNPPYGRQVSLWVNRYQMYWARGQITVGLVLVPARTDTAWWAKLVQDCLAVLFFRGRLKFDDHAAGVATFPSALVLHVSPVPTEAVWSDFYVEQLAKHFQHQGDIFIPRGSNV